MAPVEDLSKTAQWATMALLNTLFNKPGNVLERGAGFPWGFGPRERTKENW